RSAVSLHLPLILVTFGFGAYDEDWGFGGGEHAVSNAAQGCPNDAAASVRGHDDKLDAVLADVLLQHGGRLTRQHLKTLARAAHGLVQVLFEAFEGRFVAGGLVEALQPEAGGASRGADHADEVKLRLVTAGELPGDLQGLLRQPGAIERDEDRLERRLYLAIDPGLMAAGVGTDNQRVAFDAADELVRHA